MFGVESQELISSEGPRGGPTQGPRGGPIGELVGGPRGRGAEGRTDK